MPDQFGVLVDILDRMLWVLLITSMGQIILLSMIGWEIERLRKHLSKEE